MPSNISKAFVSAKIFWSLSLHKSDLMDMLNTIKRDINEHELLNLKYAKVTELSLLKSRIINEYQRYLVCLDTHDYKLKEVVKNEIFKLVDERQKLEKELEGLK